ncbi:acid protease [Lepidopterella palustris CBS 459.81]|uniref:Acid protease n=1 Tax=Lepidopterella palustris CBS 459.81 TaxID=1314670 RepID=A0A8E2JC25_9PEZI|nr:acid protease [Lepidopterella palustris CBS 459.81]
MAHLDAVGLFLLSVFCFRVTYAQQSNCSFEPVSIPVQWVTLANKGTMRGLSVSMGTPVQNFSLLPIVETNNTYLFQQNSGCDITLAACMTHRGGFYHPEKSSTWKNTTPAYPPNWEPTEKQTDGSVGVDQFVLNENVTLQQFPFGNPNNTITVANGNVQASLGLGRNSSILSILERAGSIGSQSFGYWWGLDGATDPATMDGGVVLGGYDLAKIKNPENNHTGSFSPPGGLCPEGMEITINEMILNFPNGSNPNMMSSLLGSNPITACLCIQCPTVMSMPIDPYYNRLENWTDSFNFNRSGGINFFDMMYLAKDAYQGDFTITLDSGLSIRVPNSQLVIPDRTISGDGSIASNESVRDYMFYSLQDVNAHDTPRIGRIFFTSAYIFINNDDKTFTIWEANPTTETNIISVQNAQVQKACSVAATSIMPTSTITVSSAISSPSSSTTQSAAPTSSHISGGAIGGIVTGAIVAIGVFGLLLYWLLSKRKRANAINEAANQNNLPNVGEVQWKPPTPRVEMHGYEPPEVGEAPLPPLPQELWPGRQKYKPDLHELA